MATHSSGKVELSQNRDGSTERIYAHQLSTNSGFVTMLSMYAQTVFTNREFKNKFHKEVDAAIVKFLFAVQLILLGISMQEFEMIVIPGSTALDNLALVRWKKMDKTVWTMCDYCKLCVTSTFFNGQDCLDYV